MHPGLITPVSQMRKQRLRNLPEVTVLINGGLEVVSPGRQLQGSVSSTPYCLVIPKGWSPGQTCLLRFHWSQSAWGDYTLGHWRLLSWLLRGHLEWLRDETEWGPGKMGDGRKEWGSPPCHLSKPSFIPSHLKQMAPPRNSLGLKQPVNFLSSSVLSPSSTRPYSSGLLMLPAPFPGSDRHHPPQVPSALSRAPPAASCGVFQPMRAVSNPALPTSLKRRLLGSCLILIHWAWESALPTGSQVSDTAGCSWGITVLTC